MSLSLPLQECVYHKAVVDKKSPSVLARLAKQVRKRIELKPQRPFKSKQGPSPAKPGGLAASGATALTPMRARLAVFVAHRTAAVLCGWSQAGTMYEEVERLFGSPVSAGLRSSNQCLNLYFHAYARQAREWQGVTPCV
jgi:hypothetical protein